MKSIVQHLHSLGVIKPPSFVIGGIQYETITGSEAYGVSTDNSDKDIFGFCIPPKNYVFPHLDGKIIGFSSNVKTFEQFQQHHIKCDNKEYDITIYGIVKYFKLLMENNPNIIDSIFTREESCIYKTKIADMVRDNTKLFLSRKLWHSFKGYAYSQLHKLEIKNPDPTSNRYWMYEKYGYDVKFAYHVVRLINEAEQLLTTGDMDIQRDNEVLKSIRRGEWKLEDIRNWFADREIRFQSLYENSCLPYCPDEDRILRLLYECLEEYYGNLDQCIQNRDYYRDMIIKIKDITDNIIIK